MTGCAQAVDRQPKVEVLLMGLRSSLHMHVVTCHRTGYEPGAVQRQLLPINSGPPTDPVTKGGSMTIGAKRHGISAQQQLLGARDI